MPITDADQLEPAVEILERFVTPEDRRRLAAIAERLSVRRLRIMVAGEAKRGKSTLLNRLLQRDVLPTGVTPVTAIATTVRAPADDTEDILITFRDGHREHHGLAELAEYVTERGNPSNTRRVEDVAVSVRCALLDRHSVEFVDTPGTGSVYAHNTIATERALGTLDGAVVVVSADPPISAGERDLLARVSELSVRTFVVLNKADQLDAPDLAEALVFTTEVCAAATGRALAIFPCSARAGLDDPGYRHFADTLDRYLAEQADADAETALRAHLIRLAGATLDAAMLTDRSLALTVADSADRVSLFRDRLEEIAARRQALDDRCWATERRVRRSLDESAAERIAGLTERCRQNALDAVDGPLAQLPPEQMRSQARAALIREIQACVDEWRSEQAQSLQRELETVTRQAVADLQTQLADLRAAARELLDVDLVAGSVPHELRGSDRFWYTFEPGVGWDPPLADVARRLLPGRRRRARTRLLDEIPELVDRQVGRARSDLAQRMRESVRDVIAQLRTEHDDVLGRVRPALDQADTIRGAAEGERDRRRSELTERASSLREVLEMLQPDATLRRPQYSGATDDQVGTV